MNTTSIQTGSSSSTVSTATDNRYIPGIPDDVSEIIFKNMTPGTLHRFLGARGKDCWADRFNYHRNYIKEKTSLTVSDLKAYQRIFSITPGAFAEGQTGRIKLKPWSELIQASASSSSTEPATPTLSLENVTHLDLNGYVVEQCKNDLVSIIRACPKLTSITIANSSYINENSIKELITIAPRLTSLSFSNNCKFIDSEKLKELAKACKNLTTLRLPGFGFSLYNEFAKHSPNLTSLHLSDEYLKDKELLEIVSAHPNITSIDLSGCKRITGKGIAEAVSHCQGLTSINLRMADNVDDAAIKALSLNCPHLKEINLLYCSNITDAAIQSLVENCKELVSIDLTYLSLPTGGKKFTDAAYSALANCPSLQWINLQERNISNDGVKELLQKCKQLGSISLRNCWGITNDAFLGLPEGSCPNLVDINLGLCFNITIQGIEALVKACPNLESIDFTSCWDTINDKTLEIISAHCKNLRSINLDGCDRISAKGVADLIKCCPRLQTIYLKEANHRGGQIYEEDIALLKAIRPDINIYLISSS